MNITGILFLFSENRYYEFIFDISFDTQNTQIILGILFIYSDTQNNKVKKWTRFPCMLDRIFLNWFCISDRRLTSKFNFDPNLANKKLKLPKNFSDSIPQRFCSKNSTKYRACCHASRTWATRHSSTSYPSTHTLW